MRAKHELYTTIFHSVYVGLVANVLLVVGCSPLVVCLVATDPARSWPLLALVTPVCAPALVGVFAVFAAFTHGGSTAVLRTFGHAWLAAWRRTVVVAALAVAALEVLGVDMAWAWGRSVGAVAIPVLAMLMVLVVATGVLAMVVLAERPAVRLRDLVRASLYLAVRRWYLTAASLLVLLLLVQVVAARPGIGLGIVASPLLYVVWANSRFALRPALDSQPSTAHSGGRAAAARA
ncbi:MAG TPA: hypothetical protein VH561_02610 [Micromonosporaceae bacterium]|jgi:uncharacterized membrane protein YesL